MQTRFLLLVFTAFISQLALGQAVTTIPAFPTADQEITLIFDVTQMKDNRAAGLLGKAGDDAAAYAGEVVASDLAEAGDEDVYRKLAGDLGSHASEAVIRAKMAELSVTAKAQLLTEI